MRIIRRAGGPPFRRGRATVHGSQVPRAMGNVWRTDNHVRQMGMSGPGARNRGRSQRRQRGTR
jgi:hypothetical protein